MTDGNTRKDPPGPIAPYGGRLVARTVPGDRFADRVESAGGGRLTVNHDDLIHIYNLAVGCYSPLRGFMTEAEYDGVINNRRLPSGEAWTVPVLLNAEGIDRDALRARDSLVLADKSGAAVAVLDVESVFEIDLETHFTAVFRTQSRDHPGVQDALERTTLCVGGTFHADEHRLKAFRHLRTPADLRAMLDERGIETATAFSTRNICHIGHEHLHEIALERTNVLGIAIITGAQVKGNFLPDVIFDSYEYLIEKHYPEDRAFLLNMRLPPIYAGPNEAFLQATILQNLGFTHFIVGRDHAGIGNFYPRYASQQIFEDLDSLDIEILAIPEPRYSVKTGKVTTEVGPDEDETDFRYLNGRDVRRFLLEKRYKELSVILRPDLQALLTRMFEEKPGPGTDPVHMRDKRQIFYD